MNNVCCRIVLDEGGKKPTKASDNAACFDCYANVPSLVVINSGQRALIPLGFKIALPENYEMQIRPRSGLALKEGITILNSPGTIDADYRGTVGAIFINHGDSPFDVCPGMRICQAKISQVEPSVLFQVESLDETERGDGGFGHTGV